jgi:hypothetical protein
MKFEWLTNLKYGTVPYNTRINFKVVHIFKIKKAGFDANPEPDPAK